MPITFNLELGSTENGKGEKALMIRCTQNRTHKRIQTGIRVPVKFWDNSKKQVNKTYSLAYDLNKTIAQKLQEAEEHYLSLLRDGSELNLTSFVSVVELPIRVNFYKFCQNLQTEFKAKNKLGTFRRYEAVLEKLRDYTGKDLTVKQIDYSLLSGFEDHLLQVLKNGRDTVSSNLSVIRACLNEAIKHGLACFYAGGCRGGDVVSMKWSNMRNNNLFYSQQKTGKSLILPLLPQLVTIFEKYRTKQRKNSIHIFPY